MTREERLAQDRAVDPITFYHPHDEWGWMSNFSDHPVLMKNPFDLATIIYPTSEHRFQAMKATTFEDHMYVAQSPTAGQSKTRGRKIKLRDGWGADYCGLSWYVMFEVLTAKVLQHDDIAHDLLQTTEELYEDSPTDDIWGWRYRNTYNGKNLLGRAWMDVREMLR